ncbi:DNA-binding transcriptional response regulator [Kordia jejudonensis]|uniref:response regulator n=1 Tax=Kordia jejudonensis TaxID=1348245 RepID=UPI00062985EA|nr:response regulator [Kordia jejudonensis]
MKTLIIDDRKEYASGVRLALQEIFNYREDDKPVIKTNPKNGIAEVDHTYDLVLIDFKFDNSTMTGADIGLEIRKEYPLATLILITGYGKENILKFIHVGFDAYLDKDIEALQMGISDLKNVINIGVANSQKRIKSKFTTDELQNVKDKFDAIEAVLEADTYRVLGDAVVYGDLHQKGVSIEELKNNILKIDKCIKNKKVYISDSRNEYKLIGRTSLNRYLRVYHRESKTFIINENALKVRQILLEKGSIIWPRVAKHINTFKALLNDLDIRLGNK